MYKIGEKINISEDEDIRFYFLLKIRFLYSFIRLNLPWIDIFK